MSYLFSCLEDYAVIDSCAMPFAIIEKSWQYSLESACKRR